MKANFRVIPCRDRYNIIFTSGDDLLAVHIDIPEPNLDEAIDQFLSSYMCNELTQIR